MLTVVRSGAGGPAGLSTGPYTGEIWRDMLHTDETGNAIGTVFFTPCARTFWHTHPGGQLLIIVSGEGIVSDEEETVRVHPGDLVWTPPQARHWHGATATRSMMHIAVTFGGVDWAEEVAQDVYEAGLTAAQ